jgi:hypothetical protein
MPPDPPRVLPVGDVEVLLVHLVSSAGVGSISYLITRHADIICTPLCSSQRKAPLYLCLLITHSQFSMLTPTDVIKRVTPLNESSDDADRFIGRYTPLLLHSFREIPFGVTWTPHDLSTHSYFTVAANFDGVPYKPVFFLFFIANYKSRRATLKEAGS